MIPQDTLAVLRRALAGEVTVVLPRDRAGELRLVDPDHYDPSGTGRPHPALVLFTSGSTGAPKAVALSAAALTASGRATERFLAGPGRWYLTLPDNHIAGAQVLLRSILAGTEPVVAQGRFTAEAFAADVARMTAGSGGSADSTGGTPLYTSLVPTQLVRIMADPQAQAAARAFDAILLGGAAISPALLTAAQAAGLRIVRTYGMSETCGGCVYDGRPFDEVTVTIEDGRVALAGSVVADGYLRVEETGDGLRAGESGDGLRLTALPDAGTGFGHTAAGTRSFLTSDLGRLDAGVLEILGRADDVIITGGENVSPHAVENALLAVLEPLGFAEVLVTSVPDPEWGEALVALLSPAAAGVGDEAGAGAGAEHEAGAGAGAEHEAGAGPDAGTAHGTGTGVGTGAGASASEQLTEQVRARAAGSLPRHALPRHVLVVESLPVRSIGKPDRAAARRRAAELLGSG